MLSTVLSEGAHSPEGRVWAQYGQRGGVTQGWGDTSTGGGLEGGKRGSLELSWSFWTDPAGPTPLSLPPCYPFFNFFFCMWTIFFKIFIECVLFWFF